MNSSLLRLSRGLSTTSPFYIVMLGLMSALPPFGTDAGLPGLPSLEATFAIDASRAAQTLTLFLLGFSLGPVLFGPLSDQRGRKPVLLVGVALFTLAALGCAMAPSIHTLLILRVLQGIGAGAAAALPAAIVRDVFHGEAGMSRQSYVALVNAVAPLIAPILGAMFLAFGGWRATYHAMAILGVLLFLLCAFGYAETAPVQDAHRRAKGALRGALASYRHVLSNPSYLFSTGILASTFGTMFAYITGSSSVFMSMLGASSTTYALLFAFTAAGTIGGAAANGRLAARFGADKPFDVALWSAVFVSGVLLVTACLGMHSIALTALCVVGSNFCAGIVLPNATHRALRHAGAVAGSAAALQRALQMIVGAASGALFGLLGGNRLVAMAAVMLLFAVIALAFQFARLRLESRAGVAAPGVA